MGVALPEYYPKGTNMLDDERIDATLDRSATEHYGIMQFADPDDRLAVMRNYISALEAKVHSLQVRSRNETVALCLSRSLGVPVQA